MSQPAAQPLHHLIVKVRRLAEPASDVDPTQAWVELRPLPPGQQPTFMGSIWYYFDAQPGARTPGLHLLSARAPDAPRLRYINLFFDPVTGGSSVLDPTPGWRRLDFMFNLPPGAGPAGVRAVVERAPGTKATWTEAGDLMQEHGVWRFVPKPGHAAPFPDPPPAPLRTAFVGGAPKSGTTWMQLLLNQHDDVTATGEGEWLHAVTMRSWRSSIRWFPPFIGDAAQNEFSNLAVMLRMFNLRREHTGCTMVVDKSPGNAFHYRQLLNCVPSARLVHCLRHPLDVVISRLHHEAKIFGARGATSIGMEAYEDAIRTLAELLAAPGPLQFTPLTWGLIQRVLDEYAEMQQEALRTMAERPGKLLVVRYEDMLADGVGSATRVFQHLGVKAAPDHVAACVASTSFDNLRERRGGREHQFFRSGTSHQFDEKLSPDDQRTALAYLGERLPEFGRLGYEPLQQRQPA
jgi:hypothetical protein